MRWRVRGGLTVALVVALVATVAAALVASARTSPSSRPTASTALRLARGTFAHGYVEKNFTVASALRVSPATMMVEPARDEPIVARQVWATAQLSGYTPEHLGFGIVTINAVAGATTTVRRLAAWIGLAYRSPETFQCPSSRSAATVATSAAAGWAAVVVGDAPGSPAVVYTAAYEACGRHVPASLVPASDVLSVAWAFGPGSVATTSVVATAPACATIGGEGLGGSRTSSTGVQYATVPENAPVSTCVETRRVVVRAAVLAGATAETTHAPLGLVRQVTPTARFTSVVAACSSAQLRTTVLAHRLTPHHDGGFRVTVTLTNASSRCWIENWVLMMQTVRGATRRDVGLLSAEPSFFRPEWMTLAHGARARATIGERWTRCDVATATGLELMGYPSGWRTRYFALTPHVAVCVHGAVAFTLTPVSLDVR